ncbi:hypothetical protein MKW11_14910 [Gluconobacter frateurii]|uniref:hypothetical protein n=1 Tax=Gluconobacter frateurii TaxID=38308 RepID=UPI001F05F3CB|nr:hypothetical protein [Gluconobacter frateurii]UMM08456.1 hypothetical protein MKW11_14910 [Gluconobacter frateurii]
MSAEAMPGSGRAAMVKGMVADLIDRLARWMATTGTPDNMPPEMLSIATVASHLAMIAEARHGHEFAVGLVSVFEMTLGDLQDDDED